MGVPISLWVSLILCCSKDLSVAWLETPIFLEHLNGFQFLRTLQLFIEKFRLLWNPKCPLRLHSYPLLQHLEDKLFEDQPSLQFWNIYKLRCLVWILKIIWPSNFTSISFNELWKFWSSFQTPKFPLNPNMSFDFIKWVNFFLSKSWKTFGISKGKWIGM